MSKIKISDNLFLEVAELNRLVKFLTDYGYKRLIKSLVTNFGIVKNDGNTYFKPSVSSNGVVKINAGLAYNSDLEAILLKEDIELSVSNTGTNRWIILSRSTTSEEEGTVSITSDGSLSGTGTKFTEVLRGQPNFPTKVKLNSTNNTGEYEVVSVTSDTNAVLSGDFVAESGKKYSVIGTFTPGFQVPDDKKQIYEYDSYSIRIQDSESKPSVSNDEFIIGCVYYEDGVMNVLDERVYSMFNNKYEQSSEYTGENPIVSLLKVSAVGGVDSPRAKAAEIELILEHGYTVTSYELTTSSTTNIFTIVSGNCNFWASGDIPNNALNGWLLINRQNMKYSVIDSNVNKRLTISNLDPEMVSSESNDFIIVPNFKEIEYEIICKTDNVESKEVPFFFRGGVENSKLRVNIYSIFPKYGGADEAQFEIRYRYIDDSGDKYPFYKIAIAPFVNIYSEDETLADATFSIDMTRLQPQEEERNYS